MNGKPRMSTAARFVFGLFGCFGILVLTIIVLFYSSSYYADQNYKENAGENTDHYSAATSFLTETQTQAMELTTFQEWQVSTGLGMSGECLGYMAPESPCYFMQSQIPQTDDLNHAKICSQVLALADQLGAKTDFMIGESEPAPLTSFEPTRCISALDDPAERAEGAWARAYAVKGLSAAGIPWSLVLTAPSPEASPSEYWITIGTDYENYFTSFKID